LRIFRIALRAAALLLDRWGHDPARMRVPRNEVEMDIIVYDRLTNEAGTKAVICVEAPGGPSRPTRTLTTSPSW